MAKYGAYVVIDLDANEETIKRAKELMLQGAKDLIDELAKDDRFWITKECEPVKEMGKAQSIGWKIVIPQIEDGDSDDD